MQIHKSRFYALFFCTALLLIGCTDGTEPVAQSPTEAPTTADVIEPTESADNTPTNGFADVAEIELQMLESFPVQINAIARGQLSDGCTAITTIDQSRNGFTYSVTINTLRDPSNGCPNSGTPYEESIALDVLDIPAGTYAVNVNGVQQAFVLSADNSVIQEQAPIPPTPEPTPEPTVEPEAETEPAEESEAVEAEAAANAGAETTTESEEGENEDVDSAETENPEGEPEPTDVAAEQGDSAENSEESEPTVPTTILNDPNCINLVTFDRDISVLDDTPMQPGDEFVKTWRVVNTGSCAWDSTYSIRFVDGEQMDGPDQIPLDRIVQVGEYFDISVPMTAPDELGVYRGDWLLHTPGGTPMGLDGQASETVWLRIEVVEAGTLGAISGVVWADNCNQSEYTYGVSTSLPQGCVENANGTVRGDGVFDRDTEAALSDVTVEILKGKCGEAEEFFSMVTGQDGGYRFASLEPGVYCIYIDVLSAANYDRLIPGTSSFPLPGKTSSTVTIEGGSNFDSISFGWDFTEE